MISLKISSPLSLIGCPPGVYRELPLAILNSPVLESKINPPTEERVVVPFSVTTKVK
jgi:hypothetical protein